MESARAAANPPSPQLVVDISVPPAIITSASPYSIILEASPILCVPVVHAVTIAKFGPLRPNFIDMFPETMLIIEEGTKNGEILLGPFSLKRSAVFSIVVRPPIPAPMATPILSAFSSVTSIPLSSKACIPAAIP